MTEMPEKVQPLGTEPPLLLYCSRKNPVISGVILTLSSNTSFPFALAVPWRTEGRTHSLNCYNYISILIKQNTFCETTAYPDTDVTKHLNDAQNECGYSRGEDLSYSNLQNFAYQL